MCISGHVWLAVTPLQFLAQLERVSNTCSAYIVRMARIVTREGKLDMIIMQTRADNLADAVSAAAINSLPMKIRATFNKLSAF